MEKNPKYASIVYSEHAGQFESYRIELEGIVSRLTEVMNTPVKLIELNSLSLLNLAENKAVFVMGGDGSVGKALGKVGLYNRDNGNNRVPVGIIPAGTGNIFAECLGLMKKDCANLIQLSLDVIEENITAPVDIGIANNTPFVIDVGIGPFATAITKPDREDKFHQGMFSYIKPLLKALRKGLIDS